MHPKHDAAPLLRDGGNTVSLIEQAAKDKGVTVTLSKVERMRDIMSYGVMSTPAVLIDGKVVHAECIPNRAKVDQWLSL